jgi:hypothetical protein
MTIQDFVKRFAEQKPKLRQPMTKLRARNLIDTRMGSSYTKTQCLVLRAIVDGIRVNQRDWRSFDIHSEGALCSAKAEKLAAKCQIHVDTFYRATTRLIADGLTFVAGKGRYGQNQYGVNLTTLEGLSLKSTPKSRKDYQHQKYLERKARQDATS